MLKWMLIYMLFCSLAGFIVMGIDKQKAKQRKYRISEATLWFIAIAGGAIGTTLGMFCFRHKTKHIYFKIGFPVIAVIQIWMMIRYYPIWVNTIL